MSSVSTGTATRTCHIFIYIYIYIYRTSESSRHDTSRSSARCALRAGASTVIRLAKSYELCAKLCALCMFGVLKATEDSTFLIARCTRDSPGVHGQHAAAHTTRGPAVSVRTSALSIHARCSAARLAQCHRRAGRHAELAPPVRVRRHRATPCKTHCNTHMLGDFRRR